MADEISVVDDINSMFDTLSHAVMPDTVAPEETHTEVIDPEVTLTTEVTPPRDETTPVVETTPTVAAAATAPVATTAEPTVSVEDQLRAEIVRMSGLLAQQGLTGTAQVSFPTAQAVAAPETVTTVAPVTQPAQSPANPIAALQALLTGELLSVDELDQVIDKPELLNAAYKRSNQTLVENLFQALPELIKGEVTKAVQVNKLVTTFYEMHNDLKPFADVVRLTMDAEEKANPQKTYREIFESTANQCRQRLGLKQPTAEVQTGAVPAGKPLPPAFASTKSNNGRANGNVAHKEAFDPDLDAMFRV